MHVGQRVIHKSIAKNCPGAPCIGIVEQLFNSDSVYIRLNGQVYYCWPDEYIPLTEPEKND